MVFTSSIAVKVVGLGLFFDTLKGISLFTIFLHPGELPNQFHPIEQTLRYALLLKKSLAESFSSKLYALQSLPPS